MVDFVPIVIFIVTGISNGANLTDGLDGLAAGVSAIIGFVLAVFAYTFLVTQSLQIISIYFTCQTSVS